MYLEFGRTYALRNGSIAKFVGMKDGFPVLQDTLRNQRMYFQNGEFITDHPSSGEHPLDVIGKLKKVDSDGTSES